MARLDFNAGTKDRKPLSDLLKILPLKRPWQEQPYPVVSVIAIINRLIDATVKNLLIQRKKEPYIGRWALPGGKWDFGESLADAVVREVSEETGLKSAFSDLRAVINQRLLPRDAEDQGGHFILFVCGVDAPDGPAQEQKEGSLAWFGADELEEMKAAGSMAPMDYLVIEKYRHPGRRSPMLKLKLPAAAKASSRSFALKIEQISRFKSLSKE